MSGKIQRGFTHEYVFDPQGEETFRLSFTYDPLENAFLVLNVWVQYPELYAVAFVKRDALASIVEDLGRARENGEVDVHKLQRADRYFGSMPMAVVRSEPGEGFPNYVLFTDERWIDHEVKAFHGCGLYTGDLMRLHLGIDMNILQDPPGS